VHASLTGRVHSTRNLSSDATEVLAPSVLTTSAYRSKRFDVLKLKHHPNNHDQGPRLTALHPGFPCRRSPTHFLPLPRPAHPRQSASRSVVNKTPCARASSQKPQTRSSTPQSSFVSHKTTLEELIYISGDRAASDPRDYIYALLGLVEPQTNLFEPDNSRSEFWAYQHAIVHITRYRQDLYFLFLRSGQQITSEPSRPAQSGRMVSRARL